MKLNKILLFWLLSTILCLMVKGQNEIETSTTDLNQCEKSTTLKRQELGAGILLMISGVYLSFVGFGLFRATAFVCGCLNGSFISWLLLQLFEPRTGHKNCFNLYLGVCIGSGVLIGLLMMIFQEPVFYMLSLSMGTLLTSFILSWKEDFVLQNIYYRLGLMVGLMILFFLLIWYFEFIAVNVYLSFLGGYVFMIGLDMMIKKGFIQSFQILWDFNQHHNKISLQKLNYFEKRFIPDSYKINKIVYIFLSSIIAWTILVTGWQIYFNKGNRFGVRIIRYSNDTLAEIK